MSAGGIFFGRSAGRSVPNALVVGLVKLKICNVVVREAEMEQLPYYSKGVNSGSMDKSNGDGGNGCANSESGTEETGANVNLDVSRSR